MYDAIKKSAIADGLSPVWAIILVEVYRTKTQTEIARSTGFALHNVTKYLKQMRALYNVKTNAGLIVKCAPYIKGERVINVDTRSVL